MENFLVIVNEEDQICFRNLYKRSVETGFVLLFVAILFVSFFSTDVKHLFSATGIMP